MQSSNSISVVLVFSASSSLQAADEAIDKKDKLVDPTDFAQLFVIPLAGERCRALAVERVLDPLPRRRELLAVAAPRRVEHHEPALRVRGVEDRRLGGAVPAEKRPASAA